MAGIGDIVSEIGGAVGSLFTSQGNAAEAASYTGAAQLETQNAQLTAASTRIQATQTARAVTQSLGTTQADVAGAGFTESGSALDLMRMSAQQGSLATSLVNIQGAINENAYAAMAGADLAKAKAANEANTASTIQSIASIGGALINNAGDLASKGKTVVNGVESIFSPSIESQASGIFGSTTVANAGDPLAGSFGVSGTIGSEADMAALDSGISSSLTDTAISSTVAVDTSAPSILGASADAVTSGIGDFLSGAAVDIGAGIADAAASAAAVAAGIGDAVVSAGSFLADAAIAALAC